MDSNSVLAFIRIVTEWPKLVHDRKGMQRTVNRLGDAAFKQRKEKLHKDISDQKKGIMECFDIYNKFVEEHNEELIGSALEGDEKNVDELCTRLMELFFPKLNEETKE